MNKFQTLHVDVARNATDDFNLFHDKYRWHKIHRNPFNGPIVLGFQLEALIEHKLFLHRQQNKEQVYLNPNEWRFSNYQFNFTHAVLPDQLIDVEIKKSHIGETGISNRISAKANDKLCMAGFKKESKHPLFLPDAALTNIGDLRKQPDRSVVNLGSEGTFFLKRKYMNVSNAKNFLCGSLVDQTFYFDELQDKFNFPEIFTTAYISCALLEKFMLEKLNFEVNPVIYTSHKITIDRFYSEQLKTNDVLHILIRRISSSSNVHLYECFGLINDNNLLFRALISLIPLMSILS